MEIEKTPMIEAIAVIDIDPSLTIFNSEQQKWLTSIQITNELPRDKNNCKYINIAPGIYILLSFCETKKNPIYSIEFLPKPGGEWIGVKNHDKGLNVLGLSLCYKTEPNQLEGPICDIDLLAIQRKNRFGEHRQVLNVPQGYKIVSHQLPLGYLIFRKVKSIIEQTFKPILSEKFCVSSSTKVNLSQLPLFCFPQGIKLAKQIRGFATFNFVFTLENAQRIYVTCLVFKENLDAIKRQKLEIWTEENLFYEKALCIASTFCYTDQFAECLQHLYRLSLSKSQIPFYQIIQTFANNLQFPNDSQIGKVGVSFQYNGNVIKFLTNSKYPSVSERALYSVFKFLTVDNIINVFEALLLEKKVFFVSQSKTILGFAIEAFTGLLFPFKWEQVMIPILPSSLKEYLTAPVPLVAGIPPILVDSSIEDDSVIVHLDKNQILNDEDLPPLPEKLFKQLRKRLEALQVYDPEEVNEYLDNPESTYLFKMQQVQDPHFQGHIVRDIFYEFILTLMKNYRKYITKNKNFNADSSTFELENSSFMDMFKVQQFLSDLGMTKVGSFGYKFAESSIFAGFIEKRLKNPNHPELQFFDDCINRKKAKKQLKFIEPVVNDIIQPIKNPQADLVEKGPFFYDKFPSLLKQEQKICEQEIELKIEQKDPEQILNEIKTLIQEQYYINADFYEPAQSSSSSTSEQQGFMNKLFSLLLNRNKDKFLKIKQNTANKKALLQQFLSLYTQQCRQIQILMDQWPRITSQSQIQYLSKAKYLKKKVYLSENINIQAQNNQLPRKILIVEENQDIQILQRQSTRILFIAGGQMIQTHKFDGVLIQIKSNRLKMFMNSILHKQSTFFIDYMEKQVGMDLRSSTFKKILFKTWNIQQLISYRDWIHYEKQFGTAITAS